MTCKSVTIEYTYRDHPFCGWWPTQHSPSSPTSHRIQIAISSGNYAGKLKLLFVWLIIVIIMRWKWKTRPTTRALEMLFLLWTHLISELNADLNLPVAIEAKIYFGWQVRGGNPLVRCLVRHSAMDIEEQQQHLLTTFLTLAPKWMDGPRRRRKEKLEKWLSHSFKSWVF